jgi:hypothetical protein
MVAAFNLWRRERGHAPVEPTEGLEPALAGATPRPRSSTSARS